MTDFQDEEIRTEALQNYLEQWEELKEQSLSMLRSYTDEATAAGVKAEFSQNLGSLGRTICELAHTWGADLIVTGRRGHSLLQEALLGSVSNYVMHHAPCSVLTVHHQTSKEQKNARRLRQQERSSCLNQRPANGRPDLDLLASCFDNRLDWRGSSNQC